MKILTILMLLFMPLLGHSDPLARFMPETVVGSVALKNKLVGTTWVVTAPNEVVLEGVSDRMVLLFNDQTTGFTSIDWDGQKTSGKIVYE